MVPDPSTPSSHLMAASCPILPSFTFVIDGGIRRKRIGKKSTSSTVPSRTSAKKPDPSPVKEKSGQGPLDSASPNRSKHNQLNIVPSWLPTHRCEKPPYSYATMIAHAILSSTDKRLTLGEIYHWIADRYPFYKLGEQGWQNSIRHNLSLHKAFVKLHRPAAPTSVAGKGNFWTLREEFEQTFIDNLIRCRNPTRRSSIQRSNVALRRKSCNESSRAASQNAPLFTTFRMDSPSTFSCPKRKSSATSCCGSLESDRDSDCDSGVDVGNELDESIQSIRMISSSKKRKHNSENVSDLAQQTLDMKPAMSPCSFSSSLPSSQSSVISVSQGLVAGTPLTFPSFVGPWEPPTLPLNELTMYSPQFLDFNPMPLFDPFSMPSMANNDVNPACSLLDHFSVNDTARHLAAPDMQSQPSSCIYADLMQGLGSGTLDLIGALGWPDA